MGGPAVGEWFTALVPLKHPCITARVPAGYAVRLVPDFPRAGGTKPLLSLHRMEAGFACRPLGPSRELSMFTVPWMHCSWLYYHAILAAMSDNQNLVLLVLAGLALALVGVSLLRGRPETGLGTRFYKRAVMVIMALVVVALTAPLWLLVWSTMSRGP